MVLPWGLFLQLASMVFLSEQVKGMNIEYLIAPSLFYIPTTHKKKQMSCARQLGRQCYLTNCWSILRGAFQATITFAHT